MCFRKNPMIRHCQPKIKWFPQRFITNIFASVAVEYISLYFNDLPTASLGALDF